MALARPGTVIVVGAGPTGLALACELAVAGTSCLVLERRSGPRRDSRAICLHARSMEMLDLRGQAERFTAAGFPVPSFPLGLKGAAIDLSRLDSDFPYILDMPQSRIEELLEARARELGAEIRWSSTVTGIEADAEEARVTLEDGTVERADYVVACDGIRSFVRESLSIPFPGAANPGSVILADLYLDGLPMTDAYGDLSDRGMLLVFPFRDGSGRLVLYDFARAGVPVTEPVTLEEVRSGLVRITGQDFGPRDMFWSARYRSESRQAPSYRKGRVFLAGDAAHTHSPAGAQGMNTGLQDAVNLGWKLGAALAGWAPDWLLDTYQTERHPVGADVLALTGRQFRLNTARTVPRRALRWAVHRGIAPLPPVQSWLARNYSGTAIRYSGAVGAAVPGGAGHVHPLAGGRLPRGQLILEDESAVRLYELFHDGRFVLLERAGSAGHGSAGHGSVSPGPASTGPASTGPASTGSASTGGLAGEVRVVSRVRAVRYQECRGVRLPPAVLVRPDGYVAWACDERDPLAREQAVQAAVDRWCGPAAH